MVQSNKILTVSYGTFSCTLEGFDDSFHTMKAIAEYFRDLAADDRYFGAEPPVPDAEMLARIAEREIARRVEAHLDDQGILLRAAPALADADGVSSVEEPDETSVADKSTSDATAEAPLSPAEPDGPADGSEVEEIVATEPGEEAEGDAEPKTAEQEAAELQTPATDVADEISSDEALSDAAEAPGAEGESTLEEAELTDSDLDIAEADIAVLDPVEPEVAPAAPEAAGKSASIADKLARIRAVVSGDQQGGYSEDQHAIVSETPSDVVSTTADAQMEHPEEGGVESLDAEAGASALDVLNRVAATIEGQAVEDRVEPVADTEAEKSDPNDIQETLSDEDIVAPVAVDEVEEEPADAPSIDDANVVESAETEEAEAAPQPGAKRRVHKIRVKPNADRASSAPLVLESDTRVGEDSESSLSPEDEDELMRELAELEAEMAENVDLEGEDDIEAETEVDQSDADEAPALEASENAEKSDDLAATEHAQDEEQAVETADLVAEREDDGEVDTAPEAAEDADEHSDDEHSDEALAERVRAAAQDQETMDKPAVSTETSDSEDAQDAAFAEASEEADTSQDEPQSAISRSIRALTRRVRLSENAAGGSNHDVSRLMETADKQMEEPEGRNRRNAIAHLRAAVAATQDERASGAVTSPEKAREAQFREDLDAVRPRPDDSATPKVAPLKLVAEQRVDVGEPVAEQAEEPAEQANELASTSIETSVEPRRISPRRPNVASRRAEEAEGDGFLAYAEEIGAHELPDLLEAAAAYLSFVEKRDQFSRPQLMNKVREVETREFSREDRLRFFGQLLRDGKIEKTERGRFTASDQIGFRPDERAAS